MPFLAYVHARGPDREPDGERAWEPDWRVWRPLGLALLAGFAASSGDGAAQALLALVAFTLVCVAVSRLLPDGDGLRDWRQ